MRILQSSGGGGSFSDMADLLSKRAMVTDFAFRRGVPPATDIPPLPKPIGTIKLRTMQGSIIEWPHVRTGETDGMAWYEVIDAGCLVKLYDVTGEKYTLLKRLPKPELSRETPWVKRTLQRRKPIGDLPPLPSGHPGHRLRAFLTRSGMSPVALSDRLGIADGVIYSWRNGKATPGKKSMETLEPLFKRYGV